MKKIIDVSEHNGFLALDIAIESVDGIIARCSWGWGDDQIDKQWQSNASQADKLGIPFYAYHFAYARNAEEAKKEAQFALSACKKHIVNLIYYDIEYSEFQGNLTCDEYYQIAKSFCDTIEDHGYPVGIYANENYFRTKLINKGFSNWTLWLANYGNNDGTDNWNGELKYNPFGHVLLHQCTSNARNGLLKDINGVKSKFLDCSIDHGLLSTFNGKSEIVKQTISLSDYVKVNRGAAWYDGTGIADFVYDLYYQVLEIKYDRVVIGINGQITGAINIKDLILLNDI